MDPVSEILITVNGTEYKILNPKPDMYLSDWLRNRLHLTGVKTLCKEGGCGSCIVSVSNANPITNPETIKAVNSCLQPIMSLDGYHVITIEGLGGTKNGFHVIQKKFAENFASQCGYCTPGFIMSGYSLLASDAKGQTKEEIEASLDGNICRCTGYRPILDAMKSFSKEENPIDIEDLEKPRCIKNCIKMAPTIIDHTRDTGCKSTWFKPSCLAELYAVRKNLDQKKVKFVVGNTGAAVFKNKEIIDAYVNLTAVKELISIQREEMGIKIGSAVTFSRVITFLEQEEEPTWVSALIKHFKKIGSLSLRNVATWAGNLMLMYNHRSFSSDVYVVFETLGAILEIADINGSIKRYSLPDFLQSDMSSKIILSVILPSIQNDIVVKTYKIMPRKQNSYGYVCAGFCVAFDNANLTFNKRPTIVFGGIGLKTGRANELEEFLEGKCLENSVFQDSVRLLESHLEPNLNNKIVEFQYCKAVAINLFYKFCLHLRDFKACQRSLKSVQSFESLVSSGRQSFHASDANTPLNQPLERIEGKLQASGQNKYVADLPKYQTEVYASLVLARKGNAKLENINITEASNHPGFIGFFTEKDIPGDNNWIKAPLCEEIFASKKIEFFGQPVAIVIADSQKHADDIAKMVVVEYSDVQRPITDLQEAIEKELFHQKRFPDFIIGDTQGSFNSCDHVISGEVRVGSQHHFHMEPQTCLVVPEASGFKIFSSTQCARLLQEAVSVALGINASSVDVQVPPVGGAFGGKIQYPSKFAAAAAVASNALNRPVRMALTLTDNLTCVGKRSPFITKYKVGFSKEGRLLACEVKIYGDSGCIGINVDGFLAALYLDNAYFCPNWNVEIIDCKTNTPFNTFVRAPGQLHGIFVIETIMDHVASFLGNKSPDKIKEINMYRDNQRSMHGSLISNLLTDIWKNMKMKCDYEERLSTVAEFNKANRWKKRGISLMPLKFDLAYWSFNFTALVSIYYADGTVAISHGGIEMGQGINTRVCQVVATQLGVPMEMISVKPMSTITSPNSFETGGSISSELNCLAVHKCCEILLERIAPVREKFPNTCWKDLIEECATNRVDLSAKYMFYAPEKSQYAYTTYGAACSEIEVDILTGEYRILRSDVMFDCGESVNPRLDVGQLEGAFVMGMGSLFTEVIAYDPEDGRPLTASTWSYKPPMSKDIPVDMRVYLLHEATNPIGYVRSKAVGEPGMCFSMTCVFAAKRAIEAARAEFCLPSEYFALDCPATVDKIQTLCRVPVEQLSI